MISLAAKPVWQPFSVVRREKSKEYQLELSTGQSRLIQNSLHVRLIFPKKSK